MDYPQRRRLKVIGRARVVAGCDDPALADRLAPTPALRAKVERVILVDVVSFAWNCPAHITQRYTREEVEQVTAALRARIAELERAAQARRDPG